MLQKCRMLHIKICFFCCCKTIRSTVGFSLLRLAHNVGGSDRYAGQEQSLRAHPQHLIRDVKRERFNNDNQSHTVHVSSVLYITIPSGIRLMRELKERLFCQCLHFLHFVEMSHFVIRCSIFCCCFYFLIHRACFIHLFCTCMLLSGTNWREFSCLYNFILSRIFFTILEVSVLQPRKNNTANYPKMSQYCSPHFRQLYYPYHVNYVCIGRVIMYRVSLSIFHFVKFTNIIFHTNYISLANITPPLYYYQVPICMHPLE